MIEGDRLNRAWLKLIALSGASAVLTTGMLPLDRRIAGIALLLLALAKVSIILADYLGLRKSSTWLTGFVAVISLFVVLLAILFLVG